AEGGFSQDQFSCPVCLDLLKDPVTIPCGHSYCMSCITRCWNREDQTGVYSCPQCRHTFTSRPALCKNVMFAELVENLRKTTLKAARPVHCYGEPLDVECDVCTGRKYRAVKSCLECLNSYCQNHLEQHENLFKARRHNLMNPSRRPNEMICLKHRKDLEVYCRTDQQCICCVCMMDEHKHHDTIAAAAERMEKQRCLGELQRKFQQRIQEKEGELHELKKAVESHKRSAQTAVKDSERIFTELIRSIERRRSEVTQLIRDQEKAAVTRAEGFLKQLEQEIVDLRRRKAELQQLSLTANHIHFLQFTLDSSTVNKHLRLSDGNRTATYTDTEQQYAGHPDRFDYWLQVLCKESVSGRCYWEVEWSGNDGVHMSVSYKSISRKGNGYECVFGCNNQSWSLLCSPYKYSLEHNSKTTDHPVSSSSSRIGVYVDHRAGTLSFYSVSDTMTLIHRVQTTFTQPLYPGFYVVKGCMVKLCHLIK
ncbi:putative tripartite motif-containing protein 16-like, partial [Triplophysa rosa]